MSSIRWYRSSRFFAMATSMISPTPALSAVLMWSAGVSGCFRCLCMTADGVSPSNGGLPVTRWYIVAPSE